MKAKSKKNIIAIVIISIVVLIIVLYIAFRLLNYSKELVMYKYNDMIYDNNHDYIEDIEKAKLEKRIYKCRYEKCGFISNDDFLGQRGIKQNWIIINDSKEGICEGNFCYVEGGKYFLYNVETKEKILVKLQDYDQVKDIWLENDVPMTIIVNRSGRDIVIDVEAGKILLDTNDIMYGSEYSRNLEIVNKGSQSFYAYTSRNYIDVMLYDADFNFIGDIDSLEYFDINANLIDFNYNDNNKEYFKVYDQNGNLLYTSKTYDELFINNGYIIVKENNTLMIINSEGKIISNVVETGEGSYFTTKYNKYYPRENGISIFELEYKNDNDPDVNNIKHVTQYFYNFDTKKIEKYSIDINKFKNDDYDFKSYYSNGYDTSKIGNINIYIDKDINNEYNVKVNNDLKYIYNGMKFLFSTNSNIYVYTEYHYDAIKNIYPKSVNLQGSYNKIHNLKNIFITSDITGNYYTNHIIWELATRYYVNNETKLKNNSFKSLQEKYQKQLGYYSSQSELFFGAIMQYYYCKNFDFNLGWNWNSYEFEDNDIFLKDISNYIERYVIQ